MDRAVFNAFARELAKLSSAADLVTSSSAAFEALDTAKQMEGAGTGNVRRMIPRAGSFGIKTEGEKSSSEKMDAPSWKQTAKDAPVVILGTGLGYGLGKTLGEEVSKRLRKAGNPHGGLLKHAPVVSAVASSLASYSLGRSRAGLKKRREMARERAQK